MWTSDTWHAAVLVTCVQCVSNNILLSSSSSFCLLFVQDDNSSNKYSDYHISNPQQLKQCRGADSQLRGCETPQSQNSGQSQDLFTEQVNCLTDEYWMLSWLRTKRQSLDKHLHPHLHLCMPSVTWHSRRSIICCCVTAPSPYNRKEYNIIGLLFLPFVPFAT